MNTNIILANVIRFIHILIILFVLFAPFTNNIHLLQYHLLFVPFIVLRWIFNYDKCNITIIEQNLRNCKENEGFIYKIIKPIYKPPKEHLIIFMYLITLILWIYTLRKILIN